MPDAGRYRSLWDWRRQVGGLYAAARDSGAGEAGWLAWRAARDHLFRYHDQSPLDRDQQAGFGALPFFPYDPALRFAVGLDPITTAAFAMPAGDDGDVRLQPFAQTKGLAGLLGRELTLFWIEGYGGGVFLPFADATTANAISAGATYGGGRYLLDTIKGADLGSEPDGRLVLDFNYAYNPSCSYSDRYVCPLSPAVNRVPSPVRAGERVDLLSPAPHAGGTG